MDPITLYRDHYGARLFPLRKRRNFGDEDCKKPLFEGWREKDYSVEDLRGFWADGHPIAWALGPGDLVVDVDAPTKDRPNKKGPESRGRLEGVLGQSLSQVTVEIESPSGGRHFYLTKPKDVKTRKSLPAQYPGLEFLSEGSYVVIAGSPHWQGGSYRFADSATILEDFSRAEAPRALLDLIKTDLDVAVDPTRAPETIPANFVEKILDELDPVNFSNYEAWRNMLFATHSATGGSAEGLRIFQDWSGRDPAFADRQGDTKKLWKAAKSKAVGYTVEHLFFELKEAGKLDVVRTIRAALDFGTVATGPAKPDKIRIRYTLDEVDVNDQVIAALNKSPQLYQRAGALVSITDNGLNPIDPYTVCEIASQVCTLLSPNKKGEWAIKTRIPLRVGRQILSRGSWFGIPTLRRVTTTPIFTAAGVLQAPGYDAASGVFYRKSMEFPYIPTKPTKADARAALDKLCEVVVDFPFAGPAHRSVWLAMVLAMLARPAIDGPLPMFFIAGNQAGIGKTLLVSAASTIVLGESVKASPLSDDEEEIRKAILAICQKGDPLVLFDNLKNGSDFGSPTLDAALTSRTISGRVLGQTKIAEASIESVFVATGNRVTVDRDSDSWRRIAFLSLCYEDEDPKSRSNFRHGSDTDFLRWCADSRAELIAAALVVLQAAKVAGDDLPKVKSWGSYSAFSDVVRRALVWLGEPDPLSTTAELEIFNEDSDEVAAVVEGIRAAIGEGVPKTAGDLLSSLRSAADAAFDDPRAGELVAKAKAAIEALCPAWLKDPTKAIAKRIKGRFRDRPVGGFWLRCSKDSHTKQIVYSVDKILPRN